MEERKNIVYTAVDLQRYHSGSMSDAEMHALEKAALDDPFLADALEGYAYTTTVEKDIIELKKRISEKENDKKTFLLFTKKRVWLSAAAVLVLVFGTIYLTLNNKNKETILAKNENIHKDESLVKNDSGKILEYKQAPATVSADTVTSNLNQGLAQAKPMPVPSQKTNSQRYTYSTTEATADGDGKLNSLSIAEKKLAKRKYLRRDAAVDEAVLKDRVPLDYENLKGKYRFSGKVVDEKGNPVAFASISDSLGRRSISTDAAGNYSISDKDSIFPATIASLGYNKLTKELKNDVDQTIVLSRNEQELQAVVVTSMGQVRQKKAVGYSTATVNAAEINNAKAVPSQPETGMDKFKTYINDSIKRPQTKEGTSYKGDVVLSFKIKKNGEPYNVKVETTLCKACDEEAKRLLLAGPKWNYVNNERTRIIITF